MFPLGAVLVVSAAAGVYDLQDCWDLQWNQTDLNVPSKSGSRQAGCSSPLGGLQPVVIKV